MEAQRKPHLRPGSYKIIHICILYNPKLLNTKHHIPDKDHILVRLAKNACKAGKTITFAHLYEENYRLPEAAWGVQNH
jgi:hypothetical protein